jgi:hypothetical protein
MAAFVRFEKFSEDLVKKVHSLSADALKVYLSNTAPNAATHTVKADIAEIAAGNGYVAGGASATNTFSRTGAVSSIVGVDPVFTAAGGAIATFRYAILYNDTPTSPADPLIGYWDYGAAGVTLNDGESFTVDLGASLFTVG